MNDNYLKKYCELVLRTGVNLFEGQCLLISGGIGNFDFVKSLTETAYELGAKYVEYVVQSIAMNRLRAEKSLSKKFLDYFPSYPQIRNYEFVSDDWAYIGMDNPEEGDALKGVDTSRFGRVAISDQMRNMAMSNAVMKSKIAWCRIAAPGPVWASKVFKEPPSDSLTSKLSDSLVKILRLDKKDPVESWKLHGKRLIDRSRKLSEFGIEKLYFTGPGTDLEIFLNKNSYWRGGLVKTQSGRQFIPNIPTEEVFTTPDFRRTRGKVRVTKPVKVLENLLEDISFEFKDGKVVDFDSKPDRKILEKYFATDEGASYLGEVALVDKHSEVYKSGLIFNSILYDENAACHIALGRGIPMCISGGESLNTTDALKEIGCNYSLLHTDFMIGSDEINVTAVNFEGKSIDIIRNGEFISGF